MQIPSGLANLIIEAVQDKRHQEKAERMDI
jgi:hypothetical protein